MTSLVVLASKHAVVMGTDSLGTEVRRLVNPLRLSQYFDPDNNFSLRLDADGNPILTGMTQLLDESERVPYNQLQHVTKLFKLGKLPIGAMFSGISSIGEKTIREMIAEFNEEDPGVRAKGGVNYTVRTLSERLLAALHEEYATAYPTDSTGPELELLVCGYNRNGTRPSIFRVHVDRNSMERVFGSGDFGIAFGGQMDWIQRIVFGTDNLNRVRLLTRGEELLELYRQKLNEHLKSLGHEIELPAHTAFGQELQLFHEWTLEGLNASWEEFSEQNAIDCVDFFLGIMIRAQDVSSQLPTVGGNVHIAVIRKDGFYPVTKEVWRHGDHEVPIPEVGR